MRVYFEDGILNPSKVPLDQDYYIADAHFGPSSCERLLDTIHKNDPDAIVYTNSLMALSNSYCWNWDESICELYLRPSEDSPFERVDILYGGPIRCAQNIRAMYLAGIFGGRHYFNDINKET